MTLGGLIQIAMSKGAQLHDQVIVQSGGGAAALQVFPVERCTAARMPEYMSGCVVVLTVGDELEEQIAPK